MARMHTKSDRQVLISTHSAALLAVGRPQFYVTGVTPANRIREINRDFRLFTPLRTATPARRQ